MMFTTLPSNVATSFILDMFASKHSLTRILHPFLTLGATPRRIHNSLNSIVGVAWSAPWTITKPIWPNALTSHWVIFLLGLTSQTLGRGGFYAANFVQLHQHNGPYYHNKIMKAFWGLGDGVDYKVVQGNKGVLWILNIK